MPAQCNAGTWGKYAASHLRLSIRESALTIKALVENGELLEQFILALQPGMPQLHQSTIITGFYAYSEIIMASVRATGLRNSKINGITASDRIISSRKSFI